MFTIVFGNQKGGAGKTTSTANIAAICAYAGLRVLAVDIDPQGHLTLSLQGDPLPGKSLAELLNPTIADKPTFEDVVIRGVVVGADGGVVDLLPSAEKALEQAENAMDSDALGGLFAVKTLLMTLVDQYDLVLIDSPPRLTSLAIGPLVAADAVVVPMEATALHFLSTRTYVAKVEQVASSPMNPDLKLLGILFNKYDPEAEETSSIVEAVKEEGWPVFTARIPESRLASKVILQGRAPAAVSHSYSRFAIASREATDEVLSRIADLAESSTTVMEAL